MINVNKKIAEFETLALKVAKAIKQAATKKTAKESFTNKLSFLVLNILTVEKGEVYKHMVSSFEKDGGKYHSLRMVLSRARFVKRILDEKNTYSFKDKKGNETTVSLDQVKAWSTADDPAFNVATVHRYMKADIEQPLAENKTDIEQAYEHFAASQGISVKSAKEGVKDGVFTETQILDEYQVFNAEQERKAKLENLPAFSENIRKAFMELQSLNPDMAKDLLASLSNIKAQKKAA